MSDGYTSFSRIFASASFRTSLFVLLVSSVCLRGLADETNVIRFATGDSAGVYFALGNGIKEVLERKGILVEIVPSKGSADNIQMLERGMADIAIVQSDVAHAAWLGEGAGKPSSSCSVLGLAALYTEVVQILAGADTTTTDLTGLKSKSVAVGEKGSGTELNARAILGSQGIGFDEIEPEYCSFTEAKDRFVAGEIDAVFVTAGLPTPAVDEMGRTRACTMLPIDRKSVRLLRKAHPYFVFLGIGPQTYSWQQKSLSAVGLRALLVAHTSLSHDLAHKIVEEIFDNVDALKMVHPAAGEIARSRACDGMVIPLHPGAQECFRRDRLVSLLSGLGLFIVFALLSYVLFVKRYKVTRIVRRNIYIRLGVFFALVLLAGSLGMYFCEEGEVNRHFSNPYRGLWSIIVYMVSGFEDGGPITRTGKFISVLIAIAGMGVLGMIAGKFASIFTKHQETRMPKDIEKHIVICNWNDRADRIVKELHAPEAGVDSEILIITQKDVNEEELRKSKAYDKVYFVRSDPQLHDVLSSARVHLARSIIVLADDVIDRNQGYAGSDPDATSALITLAVCTLCRKHNYKEGQKSPHVVVEVIDHKKIEHLRDAGADEVICSVDYGMGILAQCALHAKLSFVYDRLLTYSSDTNEVYMVAGDKFPKSVLGLTFAEASDLLNRNRDPKNPTILIGVRMKDGQVVLNPKDDWYEEGKKKFERFEEGDALIVMAFKSSDLSSLK